MARFPHTPVTADAGRKVCGQEHHDYPPVAKPGEVDGRGSAPPSHLKIVFLGMCRLVSRY
jgi:hypothetical protein